MSNITEHQQPQQNGGGIPIQNHQPNSSSHTPTTTQQKTVSIPLQSLPLRPSTLTALLRSGFSTTGDVMNSCQTELVPSNDNVDTNTNHNSMMNIETNSNTTTTTNNNNSYDNFAKELGCSTTQAADYAHEIDDALGSIGLPKVSKSQQNTNGENIDSSNQTDNNIMAPHQPIFSATAASILRSKAINHFPVNGNNQAPAPAAKQIVSFSQALDVLLGGGFALSELTEIAGLPGVGKTQLAMQLCVNSRLPTTSGGVQGCAVVIDAEGSWSGAAGGDRLWSMANALSDHVKLSASRKLARAKEGMPQGSTTNINEDSIPNWFSPEFILGGIHIFRVHDEASQTCTLYNLPKFLLELEQKGTPVKLVVIDSLAFHYRVASSSTSSSNVGNGNSNKNSSLSTTHNLTRMAAFLTELASEFDLAVVAMNHLTSRIEKDGNNNKSGTKLVPALGESWAHSVTSRLIIDHYRQLHATDGSMDEVRTCTLVKSPHKPSGTSLFKITDKGIRGVSPQLLQTQSQATKRARVD